MVRINILEKKRTKTQNISISPYLKNRIKEYIKKKRETNPEDEIYSSISSFYNYVLYNILEILDSGKNLKDLENLPDFDILNFYDKNTFRAFIPFYENVVKLNKYYKGGIEDLFSSIYQFYDRFREEYSFTLADVKKVYDRFEKYLKVNKLTRAMTAEIINDEFHFMYEGYYANIHHEHLKAIIALMSLFGLKVKDYIYDKNYARLIFVETPIFNEKKKTLQDKNVLIEKNLDFFLNEARLINDESIHLWIRMAEIYNNIITFKDKNLAIIWINSVIDDLTERKNQYNFKLSLLKIFKHLHWIEIKDSYKLLFTIELTESYKEEREMLVKILSDHGRIEKKKLNYQFK
ncbi:MAG: hypothetical protein GF353_25560 [Candidatus Lokiarchaeota archaeon]|nr:hypothetical protein [Candidatus Lokiarchaeota archaeon]